MGLIVTAKQLAMGHKTELVFSQREFLNMPGEHSSANIVAYINKDTYIEDDGNISNNSMEVTLSMSDCNRTVNLSFDIWRSEPASLRKKMDNAIYKAKTLAKVAAEFAEAMEREGNKYYEEVLAENLRDKAKKEADAKEKEESDDL